MYFSTVFPTAYKKPLNVAVRNRKADISLNFFSEIDSFTDASYKQILKHWNINALNTMRINHQRLLQLSITRQRIRIGNQTRKFKTSEYRKYGLVFKWKWKSQDFSCLS